MQTLEELYPELGQEEEKQGVEFKGEDELEKELSKLRDQKKRFFFNFETNVDVTFILKAREFCL
jgi:hypothetical protein